MDTELQQAAFVPHPAAIPNGTPERHVRRAIALAVGLTLLIVSVAVGSTFLYLHQAAKLSDARHDRSQLARDLSGARAQVAKKSDALTSASEKLTLSKANLANANKKLRTTNKTLTSTKADLEAAKASSTAQYSSGFSAGSGSSDVTFNSGWDAGYNSGWDYGYDSGYNACASDYYC
jgi:peptidoglycan hydrolase CwlO-like protein